MPTTLSEIVALARVHLIEPTESFWTDAELIGHAILGIQDLWKAIIDLYQDYFLVVDETNVSQPSGAGQLAGVPGNLFRVKSIEPRDLAGGHGLIYFPKDFTSPDFVRARAESTGDASARTIYYDVMHGGAPAGQPVIRVAPKLNATVPLRVTYVSTLSLLPGDGSQINPIPAHSDNALMAWVIAYARAKEREDRMPDPEWLSVYATEKGAVRSVSTPRQEDEPDVAEAMFEMYWDG